jgi:hypothetical protein
MRETTPTGPRRFLSRWNSGARSLGEVIGAAATSDRPPFGRHYGEETPRQRANHHQPPRERLRRQSYDGLLVVGRPVAALPSEWGARQSHDRLRRRYGGRVFHCRAWQPSFPPMFGNLRSTQQHSSDAGQPAQRTAVKVRVASMTIAKLDIECMAASSPTTA